MEDVEIAAATGAGARAWVAIHGPRAKDLVSEARALGADAAIVDATGQGEMVAALSAPGQGEALAAALLARAGDGAASATEAGFEQLRVLRGVPRFDVDFDEHSMPQEASLERLAVSFAKGCYLGQEAVFMLEKRGHAKKRLMRLAVLRGEPSSAEIAPGAEIALPDGTVVGAVTSVAPAPEGMRTRALGHVKWKHATPGAALVIAGRPAEALGLAGEV
jgi:tRNA-modifying protein YgfZ